MRTALLTAILAMAALNAAAEPAATTVGHDPLMRQIMSRQLTQENGGVTGAVRIGSGQAIALSIVDPLSPAVSGEPLKDAVSEAKALAPLQPAAGLKPAKPVKKAAHRARRASEQLKKLSTEERKADWSGRK
jgi:hypothetical protein